MSPSDMETWEQARAWLALGNAQECIAALEKIAPEQCANPLVVETWLELFLKTRKCDHQLPVIEALQHAFSNDPARRYRLAVATLYISDTTSARAMMARAIKADGKLAKLVPPDNPNSDKL